MKYPRSVIFVSFYIQFVMQSFYFSACKIIVHIFGLVSEKSLIYQKIHFKNFQDLVFLNNHIFFFNIMILKCMMATEFFFFRIIWVSYFIPFYLWIQVTCNSVVLKYLSFGENDNLNITLDNIKFLSRWKVQTSYWFVFFSWQFCVCIDFIMWTTCSG